MEKVLVWLPSYNGWYHDVAIEACEGMLLDNRFNVEIKRNTDRPVTHNLNKGAHYAVANGFDWFIILDYDTSPTSNPLDLTLYNKHIISMATPIFNANNIPKGNFPIYWNGFKYIEEKDGFSPLPAPNNWEDGLVAVDAVGMGCCLIHRDVLLAIGDKPFERYVDDLGNTVRSPDFVFSMKAKEKGFQCWIHYDYNCNHIKEVGLFEVMDAINMMSRRAER